MKLLSRVACVATAFVMVLTMTGTGVLAAEKGEAVGDESIYGEYAEDQMIVEESVGELPDGAVTDEAGSLQEGQTDAGEQYPAEITDSLDGTDSSAIAEAEETEGISTSGQTATENPAAEEETAASETERTPDLVQKSANVKSLARPKGLKAYSGYQSVKLTWKKVKNAKYYVIERSRAKKNKFTKIGTAKGCSFVDPNVPLYQAYTYRVRAVGKSGSTTIKSGWSKITQDCVGRMRVYVTFTKTKTYKHPNGKKFKIKKGTRIRTEGFGGGYYLFYIKGKQHSVSRVATKNASAKYIRPNGDNNYNNADAEFFINRYVQKRGIKSSKKYLIWVSSNTQHLYVFKKKNGKWKATGRDWEVSMGKAATPSPTGDKKIHKKVYFRHGINYWNCFSSMNALHGVSYGMSSKLGRTASHGCIRNPTGKAKWIYNNCGIGTRVIVY